MECNSLKQDIIIVYVVYFMHKMVEMMLGATTSPYIVDSVCKQTFSTNVSMCEGLSPDEENYVQKEAANYLMYRKLLQNLPSVFLGLLCGA